MFKIKTLICLLFLSLIFLSSETYAGDKWKVLSVKMPKTIDLGGQDWDFKVTIKNIGNFKAGSELATLVITFVSDGKTYEKTYRENIPQLEIGETYVLTYANQEVSYIKPETRGNHPIHVEILIDGSDTYAKNFNIKWK